MESRRIVVGPSAMALSTATLMDPPAVNEIWVAAGTYYPDEGGLESAATFQLISGVLMYGGFLGTAQEGGETVRTQRNPEKNVTTLSGDIDQDGLDADNRYHVVRAQNVGDSARLDGFTITQGYANSGLGGSGMLIEEATPQSSS